MVREVTGHGAFLVGGGRDGEPTARQVEGQAAEQKAHVDRPGSDEQASPSLVSRPERDVPAVERDLHYEVDEELNRVVVKILDGESGDVIRQIPPENLLKLAKVLKDQAGLLFDKHV